ncbi:MAG: RiPP maturation radical SAM C-methyltransferase [Anaerolineae bacterium]|nr:RiPP maturation radical SAM C-methyltransferase [Anaerolineae bacterium]
MNKVLLVSMPFGALERQSIGLSLLKGALMREGIACDVRYLTFAFAEFIGFEEYQWLSFEMPYTAFAGDWAFTEALYGKRPEVDQGYIQEVLVEKWQLSHESISRVLRVRSFVHHFIQYCLDAVPWDDYAIVGFTSTFEQNIASLALARQLKARYPQMTIVFGGANWEGEMGCELHRQFTFVDYVCSGEADESFPALVKQILAGEPVEDFGETIPGIIYRQRGETHYTGQAPMIADMDSLPIPDYSDYFADIGQSTVGASVMPVLLLETSRGCWWGAKSHCTFCGLNGGTMSFRSKSARRALDELEHLVDRWRVEYVEVVDNILDMHYFHDMLPALAQAQRPVQLFYEVKANLNRRHLETLRAAGVTRIQPGIESMSDHVLKLMRKGTSAMINIQLLKWCQEYGIGVDWNVLYNFPGETEDDYAQMLRLFDQVRFLKPPSGFGPIRLDRFSPYFDDPGGHGFVNIRPIPPYRYLYPFDAETLARVAYYFDYDYEQSITGDGIFDRLVAYISEWRSAPEQGAVYVLDQPDGTLMLLDTRGNQRRNLHLDGLAQAAYVFCDSYHTASAVAKHLRELYPDSDVSDEQTTRLLDDLVQGRWMISDGSYYLSLAIKTAPVYEDFKPPLAVAYLDGVPRPASSYLAPELKPA